MCHLMLNNMCHATLCYITDVIFYNIWSCYVLTYVVMLYNTSCYKTYVVSCYNICYITCVMLCYITCFMLCFITYDIKHVSCYVI